MSRSNKGTGRKPAADPGRKAGKGGDRDADSIRRADVFLHARRVTEATAEIEKALACDPQNGALLVRLAWLELLAGELDGALATLVRVEKAVPGLEEVEAVKGQIRACAGDPQRLRRALRAHERQFASEHGFETLRAVVELAALGPEAGIARLLKLVAVRPSDATLRETLMTELASLGHIPGLIATGEAALAAGVDTPLVRSHLGAAYAAQKRFDEAKRVLAPLDRLVEKGDLRLAWLLATVHEAARENEAARRFYELGDAHWDAEAFGPSPMRRKLEQIG